MDRPDPAEHIEYVDGIEVRPIDVLCGALGYAIAYGLTIKDLDEACRHASSVRGFDQAVSDMVRRKRGRENG